jgi:hypothetical protein
MSTPAGDVHVDPEVVAPQAGAALPAPDKVLHKVGDVWVLSVGPLVAYGEVVEGEGMDVGGGGVLNVPVLIAEGEQGRGVVLLSLVHLWRRGCGFKDIKRRHGNPLGNELQRLDNELRSMPGIHHLVAERALLLAVKGVLASAHSSLKFDTSHSTMFFEADTVFRSVRGMYTTQVHNQGPLAPGQLDVVHQVCEEWEQAIDQHPVVQAVRTKPQGASLVEFLNPYTHSTRSDPNPNPILLGTSFPQRHMWGRAHGKRGWGTIIEGEGGGDTHGLESHMAGMSLSDAGHEGGHELAHGTGTHGAPIQTAIPPHATASTIARAQRAAIEGVAKDIAMLHPPRGAFMTGPPQPQVPARRHGHMPHHESCAVVQPMHVAPTAAEHHHSPQHRRRLPHVVGKLPLGKHGVARSKVELLASMHPSLDATDVMEHGAVPLAKAHPAWEEGLEEALHAPYPAEGEGAQGGEGGHRLLTGVEEGGTGQPGPSQHGEQAGGGEGAGMGKGRKKGRQLTQQELVQREEDMRLWKKSMVTSDVIRGEEPPSQEDMECLLTHWGVRLEVLLAQLDRFEATHIASDVQEKVMDILHVPTSHEWYFKPRSKLETSDLVRMQIHSAI